MSEIHKRKNLTAGLEFPFLVKKIKMENGTYKEGQLIQYDSTTGKGSTCLEVSKFYGIMTDNITISDKLTEATVYITGIFYTKAITKEDAIKMEDIEEKGRTLTIHFR